jgi:hypothetical protein
MCPVNIASKNAYRGVNILTRFSRFWRPAGKQVFPVTPTAASPDRLKAPTVCF